MAVLAAGARSGVVATWSAVTVATSAMPDITVPSATTFSATYSFFCVTNSATVLMMKIKIKIREENVTQEKPLLALTLQHQGASQGGVSQLFAYAKQPAYIARKGVTSVCNNHGSAFMQMKDCVGTNHGTVSYVTSHCNPLCK
jgi:hypothetical protein